jgi:anti-sigma factor RsiW
MKPCWKNRKLMAWLALDALDARRADQLRAHIETCDPCRRYLEELAAVKEKLSAAEVSSDAEASESFHRKLVARLRAEQPRSLWEVLAARVAAVRLNWRVALPVSVAAAVVIVLLAILARQPQVSHPAGINRQAVVPEGPRRDLSPTVSNYQQAASRSPDELDDLLTAQARRPRSPAPIYTASVFASADVLD